MGDSNKEKIYLKKIIENQFDPGFGTNPRRVTRHGLELTAKKHRKISSLVSHDTALTAAAEPGFEPCGSHRCPPHALIFLQNSRLDTRQFLCYHIDVP
jgi:hypothetical protein